MGLMCKRPLIEPNATGSLTEATLWPAEVALINELRRIGYGEVTIEIRHGLPVRVLGGIQARMLDAPEEPS